eukprot:s2553_g6.t1
MQDALLSKARQKLDRDFRTQKKQEWKSWIHRQLSENIEKIKYAKASDIYKILKPKKIVDRKCGTHHRPLAGLKDQHVQWQSSRADIAMAWGSQFSAIELAEVVSFDDLMSRSKAVQRSWSSQDLLDLPTYYDLERSIMGLHDHKAPGLDGLGAEVWKFGKPSDIERAFAILLKSAIRQQSMPEMSGGWLLPLHKKKTHASLMEGYRAILLEPTLARAFSRSWRSKLTQGLTNIATPLQQGGRKGLGIEPLHLVLRTWQSNAAHQHKSLGLIFVDFRAAFYRIIKPMLASLDGSVESLVNIFRDLKLPPTAFEQFMQNIGTSNLVQKATNSDIIAGHVAADLATTWFIVPNSRQIHAPRTGSRPGDPCADILFGYVLAQMLSTIIQRANESGIQLCFEAADGTTASCLTWVDDLAIGVTEVADKMLGSVTTILSILIDVATEHGMELSYGRGKTAVLLDFRGQHAVKTRQAFEASNQEAIAVMSEHVGRTLVPVLGFYKHLGGIVTPNGSLLPEIKARGKSMLQNIAPLKSIFTSREIDIDKRRMLLKSLGISVARLHSGTWFNMTQADVEAWHAVLFRAYHMLEKRQDTGTYEHKQMFDLANQLHSPMPMEMLYIERIRLLVHMIQVHDPYVITALLHNLQIAGNQSWLYGAIMALKWAQTQIGEQGIPSELFELHDRRTWDIFHEVTGDLKRMIKAVEKAHQIRLKTYAALKQQGDFQAQLFSEIGWSRIGTDEDMSQDVSPSIQCTVCHAVFASHAALAVHEQRKHQLRIALRRFVKDATCRACCRHYQTRTRLLGRLHRGGTKCWLFHMRSFRPMDLVETESFDALDREQGVAFHHSANVTESAKRSWRWATEDELIPLLETLDFDGCVWDDPTEQEVDLWKSYGMLPPGRDGRPRTERAAKPCKIANVMKATNDLERSYLSQHAQWQINFDWVPRPFSKGQLFVLILFSGHRRLNDICSWLHWDGSVTPMAVDLAVSKEHGDILQSEKWIHLVKSRRVVGAHGAPPCETFSLARWNPLPDQPSPQPLREREPPWGREGLNLRELLQCHMGSVLMLRTLHLLRFAPLELEFTIVSDGNEPIVVPEGDAQTNPNTETDKQGYYFQSGNTSVSWEINNVRR